MANFGAFPRAILFGCYCWKTFNKPSFIYLFQEQHELQSLNNETPPENVEENASSHNITENEVEVPSEEEEMLNPVVGKDEQSIEIEDQTSPNPEEQTMIDENNAKSNGD